MVFLKEIRPSVVAENPGLDVKEIARIIGERWNALSAAEKEVRGCSVANFRSCA